MNDDNTRTNTASSNEHYDMPERLVDNLRPDQTNVMNTVFLEQRALNTQPAQYDNIMSISNKVEAEMADGDWFARDQLKKPILIDQVQWSGTDPTGKILQKFDFPEILTTKDSVVARTLSMYSYFRMTPVFRFQTNATMFHQGQVIASFDPFSQAIEEDSIPRQRIDNYTVPVFNTCYATGLPNVKLMASESDPVELEIPFVHPRNYFTTNSEKGFDILGRIRLSVLNQLKYAEGASPTLTVSVWLYARDASVHVPIYYHDLKIPELKAKSGLISEVTGLIGDGTNLIGNIMTGQVGKALRTGQGVIDRLGRVFGFDYPTRPINSEKTIMPIETLAHGKGVSRAQRLVIDPVSHHPTSDIEGATSSDPMDIMAIAKTPMLFKQINWVTTAAAGTKLFGKDINPAAFSELYTIRGNEVYQHTYLTAITRFFQQWAGGITFDLEFVATRYQTGKLLIAYVPNAISTEPTFDQLSSSCPNIIIDLQQTSSVSFTVPYVSPTPTKFVADTIRDDSIIGYLYFYIQNPLVAASNVANNVDINVYVRAADDYQLFVPTHETTINSLQITAPTLSDLKSKSGEIKILTNTKTEPQTSATMAYQQDEKVLRPRFGENYSMIDLMRRYDLLCHGILHGRNKEASIRTADAITVSPTHYATFQSGRIPPTTLLGRFARFFAAWSGSIRYKIVTSEPRTSQDYLTVWHSIPDLRGDGKAISREEYGNGLASARTNLAQDNAGEYEVPYYSPYNLLLTRSPGYNLGDAYEPVDNGLLSIKWGRNVDFADNETLKVQIYQAAGEDFRFYYLRPFPVVVDADNLVFDDYNCEVNRTL